MSYCFCTPFGWPQVEPQDTEKAKNNTGEILGTLLQQQYRDVNPCKVWEANLGDQGTVPTSVQHSGRSSA